MEIKLIKKLNNPIDDDNNSNVSQLILNSNISFRQHLKKLVEIDAINDRNGKKLYKSKEDLLAWINSRDALEKIYGQVRSYLQLAQKELPTKEFQKRAKELALAIKKMDKVNYDEAQIIYKHKKQIIGYLNSPLLQQYKRWFTTRYFGEEHHTIDEKEQKAINEIQGTDFIDAIYKASISGDFSIAPPVDSKGNKITSGNLGSWLHSDDNSVRATAWAGYTNYILSKINAIGEMIKVKIFRSWQMAKFREFATIFSMNMHDYEIDPAIADKIFKTCKYCQKQFERFVEFNDRAIATQVGVKEITPWDREKGITLNLVNGISKAEAKEDIINALSILGDEYIEIVKQIFNEKWIDWKYDPEDGQTNFSFTFTGNCKYPIKVNYKGNADEVIVLAHEIGHSVNAELSKKHNVYEGCNPLLSEVPSFVNETLTFLYLIFHKYEDNERLEHLNLCYKMMERLYTCICEHPTYVLTVNKLERELLTNHNLFTKQIISIYREVKAEYGVVLPIEKKWMQQDDIHGIYDLTNITTLYNVIGSHQTIEYYLGATIGVCIAMKLFIGDKEDAARYIKFLKSGRIKDPVAALKMIGFDVTKQDTFKPLIEICKTLMNELEKYKPNRIPPKASKELVYDGKTTKKALVK